MIDQKTADRMTEALSDIETCHVEKRIIFLEGTTQFKTFVKVVLSDPTIYSAWQDFIYAVREGALLKLVEDDEPYTRGDIEDQCPITLLRYARQHEKEHGHDTLIYGNFCECPTCGDHAHYVGNRTMLRHNRTWDEDVTVEIEFD